MKARNKQLAGHLFAPLELRDKVQYNLRLWIPTFSISILYFVLGSKVTPWMFLHSVSIYNRTTAYAEAASVRRFIRSNGFWDTCKNFLYMVILVVKALRLFDGKALATGMAWRVMYDLKIHVQGFVEQPFYLGLELARRALLSFENRWALMMIDLHWAGGMLNPTLRGWAPLHEHDQSRRILNRVFRKLAPDDETYVCILN